MICVQDGVITLVTGGEALRLDCSWLNKSASLGLGACLPGVRKLVHVWVLAALVQNIICCNVPGCHARFPHSGNFLSTSKYAPVIQNLGEVGYNCDSNMYLNTRGFQLGLMDLHVACWQEGWCHSNMV